MPYQQFMPQNYKTFLFRYIDVWVLYNRIVQYKTNSVCEPPLGPRGSVLDCFIKMSVYDNHPLYNR